MLRNKKRNKPLIQKIRNPDLLKFETIVNHLRIPEPLQVKNRDHSLTGNYSGFRECHIMLDWLLI